MKIARFLAVAVAVVGIAFMSQGVSARPGGHMGHMSMGHSGNWGHSGGNWSAHRWGHPGGNWGARRGYWRGGRWYGYGGFYGYGYGYGGSCYWNCMALGYGPGYCSAYSYNFCY
jgi:hypothetical protein